MLTTTTLCIIIIIIITNLYYTIGNQLLRKAGSYIHFYVKNLAQNISLFKPCKSLHARIKSLKYFQTCRNEELTKNDPSLCRIHCRRWSVN